MGVRAADLNAAEGGPGSGPGQRVGWVLGDGGRYACCDARRKTVQALSGSLRETTCRCEDRADVECGRETVGNFTSTSVRALSGSLRETTCRCEDSAFSECGRKTMTAFGSYCFATLSNLAMTSSVSWPKSRMACAAEVAPSASATSAMVFRRAPYLRSWFTNPRLIC